jgi:hypothetical protein
VGQEFNVLEDQVSLGAELSILDNARHSRFFQVGHDVVPETVNQL